MPDGPESEIAAAIRELAKQVERLSNAVVSAATTISEGIQAGDHLASTTIAEAIVESQTTPK